MNNDINDNINKDVNDNMNKDVNDNIYPVPALSMYSKLKRKIYWEVIERDAGKFNSYQEFKKVWDPSYKLRPILKREFSLLKKDPINYIKKERLANKMKIENYLTKRDNIVKSTRYVNGSGWYSSADINGLHRQGYTIKNSIITKIK